MPAGSTKIDLCRFRQSPGALRWHAEKWNCSLCVQTPSAKDRNPTVQDAPRLQGPLSARLSTVIKKPQRRLAKQELCQVSLMSGSQFRVTHPTVMALGKALPRLGKAQRWDTAAQFRPARLLREPRHSRGGGGAAKGGSSWGAGSAGLGSGCPGPPGVLYYVLCKWLNPRTKATRASHPSATGLRRLSSGLRLQSPFPMKGPGPGWGLRPTSLWRTGPLLPTCLLSVICPCHGTFVHSTDDCKSHYSTLPTPKEKSTSNEWREESGKEEVGMIFHQSICNHLPLLPTCYMPCAVPCLEVQQSQPVLISHTTSHCTSFLHLSKANGALLKSCLYWDSEKGLGELWINRKPP